MKSHKETALEEKVLRQLAGHPFSEELARVLFADEETQHIQEYANVVSIRRLGFNDHGPVHMRQVAYNAIKALVILHGAGVKTALEQDGAGCFEDSLASVLLSGFLHDLGMSVGRERHEQTSAMLALPIIDRILLALLPDDMKRRVVIRSMALEGILGHMGTTRIHSLEAGHPGRRRLRHDEGPGAHLDGALGPTACRRHSQVFGQCHSSRQDSAWRSKAHADRRRDGGRRRVLPGRGGADAETVDESRAVTGRAVRRSFRTGPQALSLTDGASSCIWVDDVWGCLPK